jgi:hypothetical protein
MEDLPQKSPKDHPQTETAIPAARAASRLGQRPLQRGQRPAEGLQLPERTVLKPLLLCAQSSLPPAGRAPSKGMVKRWKKRCPARIKGSHEHRSQVLALTPGKPERSFRRLPKSSENPLIFAPFD